jgi:hypothetical protein
MTTDHGTPADRLACDVWRKAHVAVLRDDGALALEVCRDLQALERDYTLSFRSERESRDGKAPKFDGIRMPSKIGGRCVVCARGISVGDTIIYNREQRQAAHAGCAG